MKNLLTTLILLIITVGVVFADTKIPVQLIKIKDGDTVDVRIEKNTFPVRLIGIDCYETGRTLQKDGTSMITRLPCH